MHRGAAAQVVEDRQQRIGAAVGVDEERVLPRRGVFPPLRICRGEPEYGRVFPRKFSLDEWKSEDGASEKRMRRQHSNKYKSKAVRLV